VKKVTGFITKNRLGILIVAFLLLIPAVYGTVRTKINYDILTYLPQHLDSMKGQTVLDKTFSSAATSMLILENTEAKDVVNIKNKVEKVKGVESVIWINDILDITAPKEILPAEIKDIFYNDKKHSTQMIIKFKDSASSSMTMEAIGNIKKIINKQCFLSGMSAIVKDTKDLSDKETPFYVLIAVIFSVIILSLTMESVLIPFIFLLGIGMAIIYNFGTNMFLGQISYITKALAAVLQLAVTMDFSIFLLHRYEQERGRYKHKEEAMGVAIQKTLVAIGGSAFTAIAGFLALCVMKLGLGVDIGVVMAKGVFLGLISTVTILPSFILTFDKAIHRFKHKSILPDFSKTAKLVTGKYKYVFIILFLLLFIPAFYGQSRAKVYYNLDESLPKSLPSIIGTNKLKTDYNMTTTHFIIIKSTVSSSKVKEMCAKLEDIDGIEKVLAYDKYVGPGIPGIFIPDSLKANFEKDGYKMLLVNSKYKAATDAENIQIDRVIKLVKSYDKSALVAGEGPLTKDLVEIAAVDFKNVNIVSIFAIFIIILLLFKSISLPVMLVGSIELAIFINLGIPYYTGSIIPFIASIVIGCIQLGSTVNYAILMATRYREEIRVNEDKTLAMRKTIQGTARSIVTSAFSFFGATIAVSCVAKIEIIKALCIMLSRGALISMVIILFVLPPILVIFEKLISVTTINWKSAKKQSKLEDEPGF